MFGERLGGIVSDDNVTIDPGFRSKTDTRHGGDGPGPRWMVAVAVLVAVVALGWLVRSTTPGTTASSALDGQAATTTTLGSASSLGPASPEEMSPIRRAVSDVPLGEAMPGFDNTITALVWRGQGVDVVRWPPSWPGAETIVSFDPGAGGSSRGLDASGDWLVETRASSIVVVPIEGDVATFRGETLVGEGTSAVWHDARPGRLGWLTCPTGGAVASLHTADVTGDLVEPETLPLVDVTCRDAGVWPERWGDWGLLLRTSEGSGTQVLLDADGTEVARGRLSPDGEWFVGVGPAGTTVWTEGPATGDASSFLLSPDGADRTAVPGLGEGELLRAALVSPDGSLLALVPDLAASHGSVVRIVVAATGATLAEIEEPSAQVDRMVWSADSRFLVYQRWPDTESNRAGVPQQVELVLFDTEGGTGVAFPIPGFIVALRSFAG
jgi:hypothetical protein